MSLIVVLGLVAVVILVVVLVALGMRASRAGDDDDWMADEQPRTRRPQAARRSPQGNFDDVDEPYGDQRVAGAPLGAQQPMGRPPMAQEPEPAPEPRRGRGRGRGRSKEEMDDDEYWSTITFDKPKFPWRQGTDAEQPDPEHRHDPLAQPVSDETSLDIPPQPTIAAPQQAPPPEPLDAPGQVQPFSFPSFDGSTSHADVIDTGSSAPAYGGAPNAPAPAYGAPGTTDPAMMQAPDARQPDPAYGAQLPAYGATEYDPLSSPYRPPGPEQGMPAYGTHGGGGYGSPLDSGPVGAGYGSPGNTDPGSIGGYGSAPAYGSTTGATSAPGYGSPAGSGHGFSDDPLGMPAERSYEASQGAVGPAPTGSGDADPNHLPSVDELLARIQSDRKRSTESEPAQPYDGGGAGSLGDPLNDPLGSSSTGERPRPASTGWSPSGGYDPGDPLSSTGGYSTTGGYGYGSSPSHSGGGYGASSSIGRYDDPLSGYGDSSAGLSDSYDPYGSYGRPTEPAVPAQQSTGYADFTGNTYGSGFGDPTQTVGYGEPGYYSSPAPAYGSTPAQPAGYEETTQAYPSSPYGGSYGGDYRTDDWSPYGDYRR